MTLTGILSFGSLQKYLENCPKLNLIKMVSDIKFPYLISLSL
jgi:hypothetical protein